MKTTFLVFLLATGIHAAEVVVPNGYENVPGNLQSYIPLANGDSARWQQVFSASQFAGVPFTGGFLITAMSFKFADPLNEGESIADIQINLSTTSGMPDSLSPVFANNIGADSLAVVERGSLPLLPPHMAFVRLPFDRPFFYNPANGNLLMDIKRFGGGTTLGTNIATFEVFGNDLDFVNLAGDSVSSVFNNGFSNSVNDPSGFQHTSGMIMKFEILAVPEPSTFALLALGGTSALFVYRRRRQRNSSLHQQSNPKE